MVDYSMYCYNCGKEINDKSRYCKYCGINLITDSSNVGNIVEEKTKKSEVMDDVLNIVDKATSYYKNDNFLQAELLFKQAIEIDKKFVNRFSKGSLWMMLGLSLIKQLKLDEAEQAFTVAYEYGCDIDMYEEQMSFISKIKNDLKNRGIEVNENNPKWQNFRSAFLLPPNEKAYVHEVEKLIARELKSGMPKEAAVALLLQAEGFKNKENAIRFVEAVIKNLELK